MFTTLYFIYALLHIGFLLWGVRLYQRSQSLGLLLLILITIGLIYDNLVIAAGRFIGEGTSLLALNQPRFLIHALMTPLMVLVALEFAKRANVKWAQNLRIRQVAWIVFAALAVLGLFTGFIGQELYPACYGDTLRYAERVSESQLCSLNQEVHAGGIPPIAAILTIIIVGSSGFAIWRAKGWVWLLAAAILMFIMAAIPPSRVGPWVGSGGEIILTLGFLLTERQLQKSAENTTHLTQNNVQNITLADG